MDDNEMAIGNPALCWVSGDSEGQRWFKYKPGKDPYICQYYSDHRVGMTAMVFADDEMHARKIIADMLDWADDHHNGKYGDYKSCIHAGSVRLMEKIRGMQLRVCKADRSQIFKIGWASNDTFGFC